MKPSYPISNKERKLIRCTLCNKLRVIFSKKKPRKDAKSLFEALLDDLQESFQCGEIIVPSEPKYECLRDLGVCVDRSKSCDDQMERQVYTLQSRLLCYWCAQPIDNKLKGEYDRLKQKYKTVLPNCESSDCIKKDFLTKEGRPGWIIKGETLNNKNRAKSKKNDHKIAEKRKRKLDERKKKKQLPRKKRKLQ